MDECDIATEAMGYYNERLARERRRQQTIEKRESATECQVCEEAIPHARRVAIPGVQLCVDCQMSSESNINKLKYVQQPRAASRSFAHKVFKG